MRQTLTIDKAIKIFKEPGRIEYHPIQETTLEAAQYNCDSEMALMMALACMERIELINHVIDADMVQEDVLKYQMICNILNDNKEVSLT